MAHLHTYQSAKTDKISKAILISQVEIILLQKKRNEMEYNVWHKRMINDHNKKIAAEI